MRGAYSDFKRLGVEVAPVTFGSAEQTVRFCAEAGAPFPCYADPERRAYGAFGLEPSRLRVLDPRGLGGFVRALRAGHRAYKGELSVWQMQGTFLIDTAGELRYEHRNRFPADNPPLEELLSAAAAAAAAS